MPNRLIHETSPYLLQHAHNPVDWYPWGEEAFARARAEDKPIFLSVGYATCHWCHVMERESFEDPEVAAFLNAHFVPIKVDREELPDVDQVYMNALQAMTGSGGWPMNMFLMPDLRPFYGGTYFPPRDHPQLPSFRRLLEGVHNAWLHRRQDVLENAEELTKALSNALRPQSATLPDDLHPSALAGLSRTFDQSYGGFGGAPKFPHAPALLYLLCHAWLGDQVAWKHLELTLERMMEGGIHDQVGGGFHRYAVDGIWRVPHFEKMLYDNAQLARVYLGGYKLSGKPRYRQVAEQILQYVLREMTGPRGEFWTAQDADSEGVEGKFYVWSEAEVREVLGSDAEAAIRLFGVSEAGNWEGVNVLERRFPDEALRQALGLSPQAYIEWVDGVRARLYERRKQRVWPLTDDKVLADWNGLMLRALAEAGRLLGSESYLQAARANARFVLGTMVADGLLRHSWRAGKLRPEAYLSDQASYGLGLLELYQATGEMEWLEAARQRAESIMAHFRDPEGGFRDSASENLPIKAKDAYDGPYPSPSALAAELLFRLAALYERPEWHEAALSAVEIYAHSLQHSPFGFPALLQAHLIGTQGSELVLVTPSSWAAEARSLYLPLTTLAIGPSDALPVLAGRKAGLAYVCRWGVCRLPSEDFQGLKAELHALYPDAPLD
ncbi:thioredoxin domain-containing protein [Calidithermus roseus]|uniref:Spermatogenesis-associated protein 20-like TRX domain-containing protein n=1 Tax=Calidithermus roseus TaxID=1644118 RepID=A0A399EFH7_9DEIN|nr:thioredoxin domain-containing protein [Calidithermus roseus]RIH82708.1 hypothetical protein Mrose_03299 [Calidithermus roseus]